MKYIRPYTSDGNISDHYMSLERRSVFFRLIQQLLCILIYTANSSFSFKSSKFQKTSELEVS